jgi:methionyl aminopeptidase
LERDIPLKTTLEVARQRKSCEAVGRVLQELQSAIRPGVRTLDIDSLCREYMLNMKAKPAMKGYRNFPGNSCISVNQVAAHGIPGEYRLIEGDIVTVDIIAELDGWHGDSAWTFAAGYVDPDGRRLIKAAWNTTIEAIKATRAGIRMGNIGQAIASTAKKYGCTVLDSFVGHGIGRDMHEEPMVLNSGESGTGIPIVPGMVLTIEPIICLGNPEVQTLDDGWTVVTNDSSRCAQFEHTVAVFSNRTEVLTDILDTDILCLDFPPFI